MPIWLQAIGLLGNVMWVLAAPDVARAVVLHSAFAGYLISTLIYSSSRETD